MIISRKAYSCKKLKKQHLYIIHEAASQNANNKPLFDSQANLAQRAGVSISSIGRAIEELKSWGLITAKEQGPSRWLRIVVITKKINEFIDKNSQSVEG